MVIIDFRNEQCSKANCNFYFKDRNSRIGFDNLHSSKISVVFRTSIVEFGDTKHIVEFGFAKFIDDENQDYQFVCLFIVN